MRRRAGWIIALALAIGVAWLASWHRSGDGASTEAQDSIPAGDAAAATATSPVSDRPALHGAGTGPAADASSPTDDGYVPVDREALTAAGEARMLQRIDENVKSLYRAIEEAERASDAERARLMRERVRHLQARRAKLPGARQEMPSPAPE